MKTTIIMIGNSRGVRIPKPLLEESGLSREVELRAKKGEIKITSAEKSVRLTPSSALLSEKTLSKDWGRPEEDKAWINL